METSTEEIFLQKLEELVLDEDKIVTNFVLCDKLNISLSDSKKLLEKYVADQELTPGKVTVTYLLTGKLKSGNYGVQIVDSLLLKEKKRLFETITSEVVYSIQKTNDVDFNIIALAEKAVTENRTKAFKGSVISEKCTQRQRKKSTLPPLPPQKNVDKQKGTSLFKTVKVEPKPTTNTTTAVKKESPAVKKTGMTAFLSNGSQKDSKSTATETKKITPPAKQERDDKKEETQIESKPSPVTKKQEESSAKKTKKNQNGKRKRIIEESDSDEDLFAKEEQMQIDSPDEEPPKPDVKPTQTPKNKRRKAVDKTYVDEEGFVVTRTDYVAVSASEDEAEENKEPPKPKDVKPAVKQEVKEEKTVAKTTTKGKKGKVLASNQPTLMNFFKKN